MRGALFLTLQLAGRSGGEEGGEVRVGWSLFQEENKGEDERGMRACVAKKDRPQKVSLRRLRST